MGKYQSYPITLAVGEFKRVPGKASAVRVLEAAGTLDLGINDGGMGPAFKGFRYTSPESDPIASIEILNTSAGANAIVLGISIGTTEDNRISGVVTAIVDTGDVLSDATDVVLVAGAAAVVLLAANSARKEAIISNLPTSLTTVRIGSVNTGAARGTPVPLGTTYVVSTKAAIYGYLPAGGTATVAVAWTEE